MPCPHRFYKDLELGYVTWQPDTLIVGTFNPSWDDNNPAQWFYGRTHNNFFWEVLPRVYNQPSLIKGSWQEWLTFCQLHNVAITDLISSVNDADEHNTDHRRIISKFTDQDIESRFKDRQWVDVCALLERFPSIQNIYLTRGNAGIWANQWNVIRSYCHKHGKRCETLLTPSGNARFQHKPHLKAQYPDLADFILHKWKEKWHTLPNSL